MTGQARERRSWIAGAALWVPGLLVAVGAGVATAHGLYEVAVGAGVPQPIAWLYPLITDGLALVAYASTARLTKGRGYAWTVVVLAAGLSGLAQASYLAGGVGSPAGTAPGGHVVAGIASAPTLLRFGVGAWPAIAAAIVAHLLFLLGTEARTDQPSKDRTDDVPADPATTVQRPAEPGPSPVQRPAELGPSPVQREAIAPAVQPPRGSGERSATPPSVQPAVQRGVQPSVQPARRAALPARPSTEQRAASNTESGPKERARAAARRHAAHHGDLPTVTQLMALADVSRGTAGTALKDLRDQPALLQIVPDDTDARTQP